MERYTPLTREQLNRLMTKVGAASHGGDFGTGETGGSRLWRAFLVSIGLFLGTLLGGTGPTSSVLLYQKGRKRSIIALCGTGQDGAKTATAIANALNATPSLVAEICEWRRKDEEEGTRIAQYARVVSPHN